MKTQNYVIGTKVTVTYRKNEGEAAKQYIGIVDSIKQGKTGPLLLLKTENGFRSLIIEKIVENNVANLLT